eukprot:TRINITY_DN1361_c0_g1_i1.p1 TRINITY_DN1361_c0_g1~~TRINITY_DN1361_c0_g1_i1.p1  ORF type:complete len:195 (+),score=19.94 TRINITY_DN1361_c0_g1_i1:323-907(+)
MYLKRRSISASITDFIFSAWLGKRLQALLGRSVYLFSEQYIVKPPSTGGSEFAWHKDVEEQLAMCLSLDCCEYLTLWCALDDATAANGALWVQPGTHHEPVSVEASCMYGAAGSDGGELLEVLAGDVIVLSSRLRHRSGPNQTQAMRRAYLVQYSAGVISASGGALDSLPLSLAIPIPVQVDLDVCNRSAQPRR